ncbi:hypothetical protein [Paraburkholderia sp. BR14264]|uniref:hypothetical protein n=1 Tax=Paraburkholderia sp. BR14264 TaxID=3237001 RepID=UPI00397A5D3A
MTRRSPEERPETRAELLKRCGITRKQVHEWIKLARVPKAEFEAILALEDAGEMEARLRAIRKAPVGGRGRAARPALRLLDSLLKLELEFVAFDIAALDDLDAQQRAAIERAAASLVASLQGMRCGWPA